VVRKTLDYNKLLLGTNKAKVQKDVEYSSNDDRESIHQMQVIVAVLDCCDCIIVFLIK